MSTLWTVLAVAAGGAGGALLRQLAAAAPWGALRGVLAVNVLGAGGLGVVVALSPALPGPVAVFLGAGLFGALTTYSTLAVQTCELWAHDRARATTYLLVSTVLGLVAASLPLILLTG